MVVRPPGQVTEVKNSPSGGSWNETTTIAEEVDVEAQNTAAIYVDAAPLMRGTPMTPTTGVTPDRRGTVKPWLSGGGQPTPASLRSPQ